MAKKKRRKPKQAARPDKTAEFWISVLSGTISGLIVYIVSLIADALAKR